MPVSVNYTSTITTVETLTTNASHQAADKSLTASLSTTLSAQTSTSNPACTLRAGEDKALSGGAATLDLTALVGSNGAAVSGSGVRVQFAKFLNPASNANTITIEKGASNGYDGFGDAFSVTLAPGAEILVRTYNGGGVVGSTNKTLDITGTSAQVLSYEIVFG